MWRLCFLAWKCIGNISHKGEVRKAFFVMPHVNSVLSIVCRVRKLLSHDGQKWAGDKSRQKFKNAPRVEASQNLHNLSKSESNSYFSVAALPVTRACSWDIISELCQEMPLWTSIKYSFHCLTPPCEKHDHSFFMTFCLTSLSSFSQSVCSSSATLCYI